jgi:peptide/nickel transport system permease protein
MISVAVGTTFGLIAGFYGGLVDQLLMRLTDVFLAFPALILAMAVVAALGPGLINAALAIGLVWWPSYARLVRGQVVAARSLPYVEAARAYGAGDVRLMTRHILPNTFGPVAVRIPVTGANAILMLAGLSFIGLGAQPPTPEWGLMIAQARRYLFTAWWYPTVIGLILFISVLAFTLASDSLQDMFDTRTIRRPAALERG